MNVTRWQPTQSEFDLFLKWLSEDREQAGRKYETMRAGLLRFFQRRGCHTAEELTDETLNRAIKKAPTVVATFVGDPARYCYGIAKRLILEYYQQLALDGGPPADNTPAPGWRARGWYEEGWREDEAERERQLRCLRACLAGLPTAKQELFTEYHLAQAAPGISLAAIHAELAARHQYTINALRIQIFRLKEKLQACIAACRKQGDDRSAANAKIK